MRVKQVMTKDPTCCLPSESAQHAASIMRDEHVGIVPVTDNEQHGKIVGVVTDRDLCMIVVAEGRDPRGVQIEQCMTTKVVTCSPEDSVERVIELMRENQIRRVPVVNEGRELLGIIALADVVERANVKSTQIHETLKKISAPTEEPSKPRAQSTNAAYPALRRGAKRPARTRSRAIVRALKREPRRSASRTALARQTREAARRRGPAARKGARKAVATKGRAGLRAVARKAAATRKAA